MAGSLRHVVGGDGRFTMGSIKNMGDAHEALEECFHIIRNLGDRERINCVCRRLNYPEIEWDLEE